MLKKRESHLHPFDNHFNLAHCAGRGYGKMQLINSSVFRESISEHFSWLLPQHNSFADASAMPRIELAVQPGAFALYDRSKPQNSLEQARLLDRSTELHRVLAKLSSGDRLLVSFDAALCFETFEKVPFLSNAKTAAILGCSNRRTLPMDHEDYVWGWFRDAEAEDTQDCKKLVLKQSILKPVLASLEKSGAKSVALVFRPHGQPAFPLALTPTGKPFNQDRFRQWSKGLVTAISALCSAGAIFAATVFLQQNDDAELIAQNISALGKETKILKDAKFADRALRQAGAELRARKSGEVPKLAVLNELSALLPDDTYVTSMLVEGNTLSIDGAAQNPESLVAVLEASKLIDDVTFTGPVTRNPGEEKSHFSMRMTMEGQLETTSP